MRITGTRLRRIIKEELSRSLLNEVSENADVQVPEGDDNTIWAAVAGGADSLLQKWMEVAVDDLKTAVENGDIATKDKKREYTIVLKTPKKDAPGHGEWTATVTAGGSGKEDEGITSLVKQIADRDKGGAKQYQSGKILDHTLLSAALAGMLSMEDTQYETPELPVSVAHHVITGRDIDMEKEDKNEGITRSDIRQLILREMRRRR